MIKLGLKGKIFTLIICVILLGQVPLASAAETASTVSSPTTSGLALTIEEAQKRAVTHSNKLKSADYSIEQSELNNESASDNVKFVPADGSNSEASSTYLKAVQSNISLQTTRKEKESLIDSIKKDVFQKYINVLTAQEKLKVAEIALKYANFEKLAAQVGYQVKKQSLISKNTAERNYTAKELALAKSKNDLEDSYRSLNNLIGLDAKERPVLQDEPQFSAYEIDDLELEILRSMDVNPDVWVANRQIEQAQQAVNLYTWNSGGDSYTVKKLAIDKAVLNESDTKQQARDSIISAYNNIFNLEQQYQTALQDIEAAEEDLNTAKLKYEMGTASQGDVLKAEADLANLQQTLKSTAYEHELAKISFDKPWIN